MAQMLAQPGPSGRKPIFRKEALEEVEKSGVRSSFGKLQLPVGQQFKSFLCDSFIQHNTLLSIDSSPASFRLTHIVCTIGPASREVDVLVKLMKAGMNICRLNFSHGTYDYHAGTVRNIREAARQLPNGAVIAIALDTKGPEIRTGLLLGGPSAEVTLQTGNRILVTTDDQYAEKCSADILWVDYKRITHVLGVGSIIYVDDGLIALKVTHKENDRLECTILNGGQLGSKKGCNLPGTQVDLPVVSGKDKQDLLFGLDQGVDMVFASFIQDGAGIREMRQILGDRGKHIKIIAKIESFSGIYNFNEILKECDGAMVARGDMGIEIPPEKVFVAQKLMISSCNVAGKPVICATQMLESMTYKPRATRAESNDVANAVLDGADCVMLSGESAKGLYPVEAVSHMAAVCLEAESVLYSQRTFEELKRFTPVYADSEHTIALAAVGASYQCMATAMLCVSMTGRTGALLSAYRPRCPIIMVTRSETAAKQSLLYRAIIPFLFSGPSKPSWAEEVNAYLTAGLDFGVRNRIIKYNDQIVLVMGTEQGPDTTNCIQVLTNKLGESFV
ncbi:unnamed protein product [Candidula unifasciata]|uniref:Pyruvate kinase n=1 Tax=Candidula unifasciata TaxID=100452 RepID=A0A8S3YDE7_9EUPU|nr:unnamed protein product [Candidula unifasciata]